jgi:hypothetical protein
MVEFTLLTRIEHAASRRYLVKVSAIPCGVEQRCAPEERTLVCGNREDAQLAAGRLAHALAADIDARGNRVASQAADYVEDAPSHA